jgi:hypothetical protein
VESFYYELVALVYAIVEADELRDGACRRQRFDSIGLPPDVVRDVKNCVANGKKPRGVTLLNMVCPVSA